MDAMVNRSLVSKTLRTSDVVVLESGMVLTSETQVDGFVTRRPAFDDGVLVEPRTGFEQAEACTIPCVLDLGVGEEGRGWKRCQWRRSDVHGTRPMSSRAFSARSRMSLSRIWLEA